MRLPSKRKLFLLVFLIKVFFSLLLLSNTMLKKNNPVILCWVLSMSKDHHTKVHAAQNTWLYLCDDYFVSTSVDDSHYHAINMNITEDRVFLWAKTKATLRYIHQERDWRKYDWILKADDDTFVFVDNLRSFLADKDPEEPIWFGCHMIFRGVHFMSGGSGYVMSRKTFQIAIAKIDEKQFCGAEDTTKEDFELSKCLNEANVTYGSSLDAERKHRFIPVQPEIVLTPHRRKFWLWFRLTDRMQEGLKCCSSEIISFHYIQSDRMKELERLVEAKADIVETLYRSIANFTDSVNNLSITV